MNLNAALLKGAIDNGAARVRKLAGGYALVSVPSQEFAVVVMNPANRPTFDFSRCRRMSRGAAHRVVNSMTDAGRELRAFYHQLVDAKEVNA